MDNFPIDMKRDVNRYQYIFIGGILSEVLCKRSFGNYFQLNIEHLNTLGANHCFKYIPGSFKTAAQNSQEFKQYLIQQSKVYKKEIIIIAHSRGGQEALMTLLNNPAFMELNIVRHTFLIQSCLDGTPLINILLNGPTGFILNKIKSVVALQDGFYQNFYKKKIYKLTARQKRLFQERVHIIRTNQPNPKSVSPILKLGHHLLKKAGHHSDGLIPLDHQGFKYMKLKTLTYQADHSDFIIAKPMTLSPRSTKERFTDMLLDIIFTTHEKNQELEEFADCLYEALDVASKLAGRKNKSVIKAATSINEL